jgi:cell wall-active antibiotic response 4TMS protein YvqF
MYRNRGFLFPLILIAIGVIVLLANTGVLSPQALERLGDLWPLLLVILGLQLILNHTLPRQQATLIGLAASAIIVVAAVAYAALAPAASLGTQRFDSSERLGGLSTATLDVNYGAATIDVSAAGLGDSLYQAQVDYPAGENPPIISLDRETGTLQIHESSTFSPFHLFGGSRRHLRITLTDQIPWSIQIGGGAESLRLDLRHALLSKLEISGGANQLDAQLPSPKGTVSISVSGGANNVTLAAPARSQWRVAVSGGVSAVTINGSSSGNLGGDFQQQSPEYNSATDRFDIEISGGASHIDFRTS